MPCGTISPSGCKRRCDLLRLMAAYLFWEVSLLALGSALALLALWQTGGKQADSAEGGVLGAEFLACALTVKLLLGAAIPHTLVFVGGGG